MNGGNGSIENSRNDEHGPGKSQGWLNWLSRGMLGAGGTDDSGQFSGVVSDDIVKVAIFCWMVHSFGSEYLMLSFLYRIYMRRQNFNHSCYPMWILKQILSLKHVLWSSTLVKFLRHFGAGILPFWFSFLKWKMNLQFCLRIEQIK